MALTAAMHRAGPGCLRIIYAPFMTTGGRNRYYGLMGYRTKVMLRERSG